MRHDGMRRVLTILRTLQSGGQYSLYGLADEHGVNPRTIRRDLELLSAVGYPICKAPESGDGPRGYWWIESARSATPHAKA
jgi:predicted DNA-binding transcriptional regulator YafY